MTVRECVCDSDRRAFVRAYRLALYKRGALWPGVRP